MLNDRVNYDEIRINKLKNIWNSQELQIIYELFLLAEQNLLKKINNKYVLNSITAILNGKDKQSYDIIYRIATSL